MSLKQQLITQMKDSMKSHDKVRLETIRFILSKIKNVEIDEGQLDDSAVQKVIKREVKQTEEAIDQFQQAGRDDLVQSEQAKVEILKEFLPKEMSQSELAPIIDRAINERGSKMGPVIGRVMELTKGQADGSLVAKLVKERLAN